MGYSHPASDSTLVLKVTRLPRLGCAVEANFAVPSAARTESSAMLEEPDVGFEALPLYPAVLKVAIAASTASATTIFLMTSPYSPGPAPDRVGATRVQVSVPCDAVL